MGFDSIVRVILELLNICRAF